MKKAYAIKLLKRIKELCEKKTALHALGVEIIDLDTGIDLLEEAVAMILSETEKEFEFTLNEVQWWLYERVDKKYYLSDSDVDVSKPEDFIDFLLNNHKIYQSKK